VILVDLGVSLPAITLGDAGRAGRASGVNGDINTFPSQIEFPSSNPSNPLQTAVITNLGASFNDINGNPAFDVNTENKTFNARDLHCTWDRNNDNVADVDFWQNGTVTFDCDLDGSADYDFGGNFCTFRKSVICRSSFRCNVGGDLVDEFLVNNGSVDVNAACNIYAGATGFPNFSATGSEVICDPNGDGVIEWATSDNSIAMVANTTIDGSLDIGGNGTVEGGLYVDNFSDGNTEFAFANGEMNIDINGDGVVDLSLTGGGATPTLTLNGDFFVNGNKFFVQQHPADPAKEIVYVCLEGGEAGTYTRGSSNLVNGTVTVSLPAHFGLVTNATGLTAQITPRGLVQGMLYVECVTSSQLVVKASNPADASVPFDFMINGLRKGFENHQVIRDKQSFAATR
jgi:hypothetical protein